MNVLQPTQAQFELIDNENHKNISGDLTAIVIFGQHNNNDWCHGISCLTDPSFKKKFDNKTIDDNGTMKSVLDILKECSVVPHVPIPNEESL